MKVDSMQPFSPKSFFKCAGNQYKIIYPLNHMGTSSKQIKENFIHIVVLLKDRVVFIAIKTHVAKNNAIKFPCIFQINSLQLSFHKWLTSNYHIYTSCISLNNITLLFTYFLPFLKSPFLDTLCVFTMNFWFAPNI